MVEKTKCEKNKENFNLSILSNDFFYFFYIYGYDFISFDRQ